MINFEESINDFEQYKKDILLLIKYVVRVGTIELSNYKASIVPSGIASEYGIKCWRFELQKARKGAAFNKYCDVISLVFIEDDGNVLILQKYAKNVNYSTQLDFIKFMKELEDDLAIRSQERNSYEDSAKVFRELMNNI